MKKVKNTIPVYDICSLDGKDHVHRDIIADRFADYLKIHPNLHLAHGHSFYHIVYFTKGTGFHTIDFERFPVSPGQIYFMIPGQVHSWAFEGEVDGYVINFSGDIFKTLLPDLQYLQRFRFLAGIIPDNVKQIPASGQTSVVAVLEQIITEVANAAEAYTEMVQLQLLTLFILVARTQAPKRDTEETPRPNLLLLYNFRKLVDKYYAQYKLPKDYAALLYITPNHLNALCRDLLNRSAGELIRDRVILEARRQLVNADAPISGIAYELGFADNSYFTKFFKKYTGSTPEEFRKRLQQPAT